jgi:acyl-CoA synthetase (AMP-forming)/AMP-acid ligase II
MISLFSVLDDAAAAVPDKPLFIFPPTRTRGELSVSYRELAERSEAAGRKLSQVAKPGECALLLFPAGPDFWSTFFGCLRRGIIAIPLHVPNINRPNEMLQNVCEDCRPAMIVTDQGTADLLNRRAERHPYLNGIPVVTPEDWETYQADTIPRMTFSAASSPALIQYTSGSTSRPRGVQISHENLIANLKTICRQMEIRVNEDCGVTWLPHYHDMGLVGGCLTTLYSRNTTLCLPPEEFAVSPLRWLELISATRATVCGGPNFAYQLCADKVTDEQASELDLSSWRVAYVGAERIRPETMDHFCGKFSPAGFQRNAFFPCYGLGEATLFVTGGPVSAAPQISEVSAAALVRNQIADPEHSGDVARLCGSGSVIDDSVVAVVSADTNEPLDDEHIGEIYIAGDSVTKGYWGNTNENEGLFRSIRLKNATHRMLRTGDLGFLAGGELFITGRAKELIIIRGRNLYPEDLEHQVRNSHESLIQGAVAAFAVDRDGQEMLVIVAEISRTAVNLLSDPEPIVAAIRQRIVEHFGVNPLEIRLVRPATIPHTTSGKPRRLKVREAWLNGELPGISPEGK